MSLDFLDLHIFTSPKGGVGKTALLKALFRSQTEELSPGNGGGWGLNKFTPLPIVALDLNTTNYDLYNEASFNRGNRDHGSRRNLYYIPPSGTPPDKTYQAGYIYRRQKGFQLFDGIGEFWEHIKNVALFHRTYSVHEINNNANKLIMLVDTNVHVASLADGNNNPSASWQDLAKDFKRTNIYIWFIWTVSAARNSSDRTSTEQAVSWLEAAYRKDEDNPYRRLPDEDERRFMVEYMHVLSPIGYLPPVRWGELINVLRGRDNNSYSIRSLVDIAQLPTVASIPFGEFYEIASQTLHTLKPEEHDYDMSFDDMRNVLDNQYHGRPWNVIAIPSFYRSLRGATEGFGGGQPQLVESAYEHLADILTQYYTAVAGTVIDL